MEAFVYCWTDRCNDKLYVGSHRGSTEDGYVCSSKYMMEEYKKRPQDFTRQIVAQGTWNDIRHLEALILQSVDAKNDDHYYNKHNNDGFYFDGWHAGEFTEEHRKNMSIASSKRVRTAEHLEKLHQGRRNSKNSPEHNAAISKAVKGRTPSEESRLKMSLAKKDKKLSAEHKAKLGKGDHSYMQTKEYRMKMRAVWAKRKGELVNAD